MASAPGRAPTNQPQLNSATQPWGLPSAPTVCQSPDGTSRPHDANQRATSAQAAAAELTAKPQVGEAEAEKLLGPASCLLDIDLATADTRGPAAPGEPLRCEFRTRAAWGERSAAKESPHRAQTQGKTPCADNLAALLRCELRTRATRTLARPTSSRSDVSSFTRTLALPTTRRSDISSFTRTLALPTTKWSDVSSFTRTLALPTTRR